MAASGKGIGRQRIGCATAHRDGPVLCGDADRKRRGSGRKREGNGKETEKIRGRTSLLPCFGGTSEDHEMSGFVHLPPFAANTRGHGVAGARVAVWRDRVKLIAFEQHHNIPLHQESIDGLRFSVDFPVLQPLGGQGRSVAGTPGESPAGSCNSARSGRGDRAVPAAVPDFAHRQARPSGGEKPSPHHASGLSAACRAPEKRRDAHTPCGT